MINCMGLLKLRNALLHFVIMHLFIVVPVEEQRRTCIVSAADSALALCWSLCRIVVWPYEAAWKYSIDK